MFPLWNESLKIWDMLIECVKRIQKPHSKLKLNFEIENWNQIFTKNICSAHNPVQAAAPRKNVLIL